MEIVSLESSDMTPEDHELQSLVRELSDRCNNLEGENEELKGTITELYHKLDATVYGVQRQLRELEDLLYNIRDAWGTEA